MRFPWHADTIMAGIEILARRFCDSGDVEGYRKDGPVAAARFEGADEWENDARILRQRDLSTIVQDAMKPFL